jgi:hypothetical protein
VRYNLLKSRGRVWLSPVYITDWLRAEYSPEDSEGDKTFQDALSATWDATPLPDDRVQTPENEEVQRQIQLRRQRDREANSQGERGGVSFSRGGGKSWLSAWRRAALGGVSKANEKRKNSRHIGECKLRPESKPLYGRPAFIRSVSLK